MAKKFGVDKYQFEVVEGWPKQEIKGVAASVACDSKGRAYVGIRNIPAGGGFGNILPGEGRVLVLNPDGSVHGDWDFKFTKATARLRRWNVAITRQACILAREDPPTKV